MTSSQGEKSIGGESTRMRHLDFVCKIEIQSFDWLSHTLNIFVYLVWGLAIWVCIHFFPIFRNDRVLLGLKLNLCYLNYNYIGFLFFPMK